MKGTQLNPKTPSLEKRTPEGLCMKSNVKHVSLRQGPASLARDKDPWFANASVHFQNAIYQALQSHRDVFANRFPTSFLFAVCDNCLQPGATSPPEFRLRAGPRGGATSLSCYLGPF